MSFARYPQDGYLGEKDPFLGATTLQGYLAHKKTPTPRNSPLETVRCIPPDATTEGTLHSADVGAAGLAQMLGGLKATLAGSARLKRLFEESEHIGAIGLALEPLAPTCAESSDSVCDRVMDGPASREKGSKGRNSGVARWGLFCLARQPP